MTRSCGTRSASARTIRACCEAELWCSGQLLKESCLCAADEAVAKLAEETGHPERLAALAIDISSPKSVETAAQTLERDFIGKLGGLINNAAVSSEHPDIATPVSARPSPHKLYSDHLYCLSAACGGVEHVNPRIQLHSSCAVTNESSVFTSLVLP